MGFWDDFFVTATPAFQSAYPLGVQDFAKAQRLQEDKRQFNNRFALDKTKEGRIGRQQALEHELALKHEGRSAELHPLEMEKQKYGVETLNLDNEKSRQALAFASLMNPRKVAMADQELEQSASLFPVQMERLKSELPYQAERADHLSAQTDAIRGEYDPQARYFELSRMIPSDMTTEDARELQTLQQYIFERGQNGQQDRLVSVAAQIAQEAATIPGSAATGFQPSVNWNLYQQRFNEAMQMLSPYSNDNQNAVTGNVGNPGASAFMNMLGNGVQNTSPNGASGAQALMDIVQGTQSGDTTAPVGIKDEGVRRLRELKSKGYSTSDLLQDLENPAEYAMYGITEEMIWNVFNDSTVTAVEIQ